ncbi:MAG: 50S ribosomal protein L13 [Thermoplasmata archaeon]|nr:MAG: 50S ribosomal protein L13 [Thermoplasmata archaeon]
MAIIDVSNAVVGRVASRIAKRLLDGEEIIVVNVEEAIMTGNRDQIIERYMLKRELGSIHKRKGPKYPRMPDRLFRRVVRGMLPYKKPHGKEAFKRLKVYIGVPKELKDRVNEFERAAESKKYKKYIKLGEISRMLGAKFEVKK